MAHSESPAPAVPALRWVVLLALSLALHLLVLNAADGVIGLRATAVPATPVVTAQLHPAAPPPAIAAPPGVPAAAVAADPPPAAPRRARPMPKQPTAPAATPFEPVPALASADLATPPEGTPSANTPGTVEAGPAAAPAPPVAAPVPTELPAPPNASNPAPAATPGAAAPRGVQYKVSLPPAATLAYEVRYSTRGNITRGSSVVTWHPNGGAYAIRGEVTKFGIVLSSFRSEGAIDDTGIAPDIYAEKNARRSETNTHFSRDARQAISFSAATDSLPLLVGAQDRGSILWQLSGIARADRAAFVPGGVLDIFVAGVRDAEHWLIEVVGEESITLENGEARAWHLVRAPRAGTYDKRIDIWLAPTVQWYPVKLRYTEVSGDYLDLSLTEVREVR